VRVVGVKHEPARRYDAGVAVDEVLGLDALDEALPRADHVCLTVPLTDATRRLMNARRLARMRPGAFLYNVSRGAVVDQAALVAALRAGQLVGAGLDVFEEEPLGPALLRARRRPVRRQPRTLPGRAPAGEPIRARAGILTVARRPSRKYPGHGRTY
jgi:phosphoglycerate dehydrogenase-like enzyme